MDQAHLETDKIIDKIAKRLNREYKTANKDMEKKLEKYLKAFDRKDREKRDLLKQGLISEQEYKDWRIGQIMIGKRWEEMLDTLAQDYHNTNEIARQIAKDNAYDVYALNHDYGTFQVEKESLVDTSYTLYDRGTVSRLAQADQKMLPDPSERTLKRIRDAKEKRWSKQKLNSAIMQGILQGEPLAKVAKRLQSVTNMEKAQAMRNARTMMTNAQSAGRYDAYRRAKGMGIDFKVVWIATLDNRTRHEHRQLDGQMQDVDTPFEVDGQKIMYPADLGGSGYKVPPELIYNCRCTIGAAIPGTKLYEQGLQGVDRFSRLGDMSYEEWKNEHQNNFSTAEPVNTPKTKPFESVKIKGALGEDYEEFRGLVDKSETKGLFDKYSDQCNRISRTSGGGVYRPLSDSIEFSYSKDAGTNKFGTLAHESGHMFDAKIGRHPKLHFNEIDTINNRCKFGSGTFKFLKETPSMSDEFLSALRRDAERLRPMIKDRSIVSAMLATKETRNASGNVQDFLDGLFSTQDKGLLPWGHGDRYYNRAYNRRVKQLGLEKQLKEAYKELGFDASNQAKVKRLTRLYETSSEAWANVNSAVTVGGMELEEFEKYMPETVKAFKGIIKVVQ